MTPNVVFSQEVENQQIRNSSKRHDEQYHQSPHWNGKVRINPFSPVPSKYLAPRNSTKSSQESNSCVGFPILSDKNISPARRSRRLKPKSESFPPAVLKDNVSPTDVTEDPFTVDIASSSKRKFDSAIGVSQSSNKDLEPPLKQLKSDQSRYFDDFEEVRHLGSGSFGSVNACLSRLDGCMYAIKSVSPQGIQRSKLAGYDSSTLQSDDVYRGRQDNSSIYLPPVPPTPRRDIALAPIKKKHHLFDSSYDTSKEVMDGGMATGAKHWSESALNRMLTEVRFSVFDILHKTIYVLIDTAMLQVHALAALSNEADAKTFHIVRYHQAWFENDGTLYIQTELCTGTLKDKIKSRNNEVYDIKSSKVLTNEGVIEGIQRLKCLREILLALQLVHSKGMVHLDIKPDNIFVQNDLYKLGDFGLAGIATSTDVEEGDSRYMSREMLQSGHKDLTKVRV